MGEQWQVAAADNLWSREDPSAAKFLLLRPWAARTNQVRLHTDSGLVRFPDRLFWAGQAFHLEHHFDASGATPVCRLEFTPQQPPLVDLNVSGESL